MSSTIVCPPERLDSENQRSLLDEKGSSQAPNSYMLLSVLANVCCLFSCMASLVCSLPALVFSLNTRESIKIGDLQKAKKTSALALVFNFLTGLFIILVFVITIVVIIYVVLVGASAVEWFCNIPLNFTC